MARRGAVRVVAGMLVLAACAGTDLPGSSPTSPRSTSSAVTTSGRPPQRPATPTPTAASPTTGAPTSVPGSRTSDSRPSPSTRAQPSTSATPEHRAVAAGRNAWVSVSVATLWRSPTSPRAVDTPALRAPADLRGWLGGMTTAQRRGLVGRADTQALLGDRVVVTTVRGTWAKVVVPDQPTPLDRRGYPGWVPVRQLDPIAPASRTSLATVVATTTWLRADTAAAVRLVQLSYGTRLPSLGSVGGTVRVALPGGATARVSSSAVVVHRQGLPAQAGTGAALVRSAQSFTGLPYLWAGRSGFGFDCSGLTSLVLRVHGVRIPRDADAQAVAGGRVASSALAPGDLLFYARDGYVHHVAMYAGQGRMVQSPATGRRVETIAVTTPSYAAEFSGARRFT